MPICAEAWLATAASPVDSCRISAATLGSGGALDPSCSLAEPGALPACRPKAAGFTAFDHQAQGECLAIGGYDSTAKVPSLAGQSSPNPPPRLAILGFGLLYAPWRSHSATQRALRG